MPDQGRGSAGARIRTQITGSLTSSADGIVARSGTMSAFCHILVHFYAIKDGTNHLALAWV